MNPLMKLKNTTGRTATKLNVPAKFLTQGAIMAMRHTIIDRQLKKHSVPLIPPEPSP